MTKKIAIVTGAARGIGKAITIRFLKEGLCVMALDKDEAELAVLLKELDSDLTVYPVNIASYNQIEKFFAQLSESDTTPYALVNNAGIFPGTPFLEYRKDKIEEVLDINLLGPIFMTQHFGKLLKSRNASGVIVNVASIAGQAGSADTIYGISKSGVIGLTKNAAMALAPNIRVNAVAPSMVQTELIKNVSAERTAVFKANELLKEDIHPEDIANSVWFLLSDQSKHFTGATLDINNGFALR